MFLPENSFDSFNLAHMPPLFRWMLAGGGVAVDREQVFLWCWFVGLLPRWKIDWIGLWQPVTAMNLFLTTSHYNRKLPAVLIKTNDPALKQVPKNDPALASGIWGVPYFAPHNKSITIKMLPDCHNLCWVYVMRVTGVRLLYVKKNMSTATGAGTCLTQRFCSIGFGRSMGRIDIEAPRVTGGIKRENYMSC